MQVGHSAGGRTPRRLDRGGMVLLAIVGAWLSSPALAASHRTANFVVEAPTAALARRIGDAAEQYRHTLAVEWTGRRLLRLV